MMLEEIALRILCASIASGKALNFSAAVRESFALAVAFQEQAKEAEKRVHRRKPLERLSFDDNGL